METFLRENVTKNVTKKSDRWDFLENFWNIYTNPQEREYCYFYFISIGYRINRMMLKKWMDIRLSPTAPDLPFLSAAEEDSVIPQRSSFKGPDSSVGRATD